MHPESRFTKRGEHGAHICVKIRMPCKPLAPTPRRPPSCFRMSPLYLPFWRLQHAGVRRVAGHPHLATPRPSTPPPALLWSHRHHRERLPGATLAASSTRRERSWCCLLKCGAQAPRWAAKPEPGSLRYAWPLPTLRDVSLAYLACRRLLRRGAEGRGDASRQTMLLLPHRLLATACMTRDSGLHGAASLPGFGRRETCRTRRCDCEHEAEDVAAQSPKLHSRSRAIPTETLGAVRETQ